MQDVFDLIASSSATGTGNWLRDGRYVLAVKEITFDKKFKDETWLAKFIVLASASVNELVKDGKAVPAGTPGAMPATPNAPGEEVSWAVPKGILNFGSNIKAFLLAFTNTSEADFNAQTAAAKAANQPAPADAIFKAMIDPSRQAARGFLIGCNTFRKPNQGRRVEANKGTLMVLPSWFHVARCADGTPAANVNDEVTARRDAIAKGLPIAMPAWLSIPGLTPSVVNAA